MGTLTDFRAAASVLLNRFRFGQMAGLTFDGRRDTYSILGYPQFITAWDYREKYARGGIAKAIVDAYPAATWRGGVEVFEDEDPDTDTEFEQAFKALDNRLHFWQALQQVDTLAGLSTFAVLLIGAEGLVAEELPKGGAIKFLKSFSGGGGGSLMGANRNQMRQDSAFQCAARVTEYDIDPQSERFGEPLFYSIRVANGLGYDLVRVHWSRVVHVAEGCLDDNVFGIPVLESVFNLLLDLEKVTGGGSEAFFLRANQGLHLDIDKDMGVATAPGQPVTPGLSATQVEAIKDKAEELQHQLQRVLVTRGVTATQLGSDVAQFGTSCDAILKQIAGSKGIPMRILTGSEMGTLASEQDAANFDSRVQDRRTGYAGPKIVRRIIDRLIAYEMLPKPSKYEVGWPVEENMDEAGKADFAVKLATVNKTMGVTTFTDDEVRDMCFDLKPLTPEQKVPVAAPVRETGAVPNANNPDDSNAPVVKQPVPPALKAAEAETLAALEAAIENDDAATILKIIGIDA